MPREHPAGGERRRVPERNVNGVATASDKDWIGCGRPASDDKTGHKARTQRNKFPLAIQPDKSPMIAPPVGWLRTFIASARALQL